MTSSYKFTSIDDATIKNPTLTTTNNSTTYTLNLPKKNGTLATTDDIPAAFDTSDFVSASEPRFNSYTIHMNTSSYTFPSGEELAVLTDRKSQTVNNKQLSSSNQIKDGTLLSKSGNTLTFPDTTSTLATTSDITSATSSLATQSALADVSSNLSALETRVNGIQPARVFDTKADMDTWLANSANTASLVIGTNLFIKALDVPDYWWNGTSASELETAKTDLTNCATLSGTEELTNKTLTSPTINTPTITNPTLKDSSTSYKLTVPTLSTTDVIATTEGTQTLKNKTLTSTCSFAGNINGASLTTDSTSALFKAIINAIYPVGSVIFGGNKSATSPQNRFTWQTWTVVSQGYYVATVSTLTNTGTNMPTSGTANTGAITSSGTAITTEQLPAHTHTIAHSHTGTSTSTSTFTGTEQTDSFYLKRCSNSTESKAWIGKAQEGTLFTVAKDDSQTTSNYTWSSSNDTTKTLDKVQFKMTPTGSVSTSTTTTTTTTVSETPNTTVSGSTGGGQTHTHTTTIPRLTLLCWIRTA